MNLTASLIVRDEVLRYLPECIGHLLTFCDRVVVLDDGSTDGTGEYLDDTAADEERLVVHHLDAEEGFFSGHEGRKRQQLLVLTLNQRPEWVLNLDADELVTDGGLVRAYAEESGRPVGTLDMEEVWKAERNTLWIRVDGGWRPHPVPCLWSASLSGQRGRALKIADRALACGREPEVVRRYFGRSRPTGSSLLHLGWSNEADRPGRYARYVTADGGRFHRNTHLESILLPDADVSMVVRPWPLDLVPFRDAVLERANRRERDEEIA